MSVFERFRAKKNKKKQKKQLKNRGEQSSMAVDEQNIDEPRRLDIEAQNTQSVNSINGRDVGQQQISTIPSAGYSNTVNNPGPNTGDEFEHVIKDVVDKTYKKAKKLYKKKYKKKYKLKSNKFEDGEENGYKPRQFEIYQSGTTPAYYKI